MSACYECGAPCSKAGRRCKACGLVVARNKLIARNQRKAAARAAPGGVCLDCGVKTSKPTSKRCVACANKVKPAELGRTPPVCTDCGVVVFRQGSRCRDCYSSANKYGLPAHGFDWHDSAQAGCAALLRRQLVTGQHWLTDPAAFAAACASVGLAA